MTRPTARIVMMETRLRKNLLDGTEFVDLVMAREDDLEATLVIPVSMKDAALLMDMCDGKSIRQGEASTTRKNVGARELQEVTESTATVVLNPEEHERLEVLIDNDDW